MNDAPQNTIPEIATLSEHLQQLAGARVAVIGDHALDAYWELDEAPGELSQETGLATSIVANQRYAPGGASNVVANLRALGVADVRAIGVVGDDLFGRELTRRLSGIGADTAGLVVDSAEQTLVFVKPVQDGVERARLDFGTRRFPSETVLNKIYESTRQALADGYTLVVNQQVDTGLLTRSRAPAFREIFRLHADRIIVDSRHHALDFGPAILKLNRKEAAAIDGHPTADLEEASALALNLNRRTGQPVVLTLGAQGAIVAANGESRHLAGIELRGPIDPVGCGDTFVAALAAAHASGIDILTSAQIANLASAVTVRKVRTTGTASAAEILDLAMKAIAFSA